MVSLTALFVPLLAVYAATLPARRKVFAICVYFIVNAFNSSASPQEEKNGVLNTLTKCVGSAKRTMKIYSARKEGAAKRNKYILGI